MSELRVTPTQLRSTAEHLADVASRMRRALLSLQDQLDAEGAAWGGDKIGRQFAEGSGGYVAQTAWVDGSIDAKADLLETYAEGLRDAANTLEQQDSV